jgi:hypothetical protein
MLYLSPVAGNCVGWMRHVLYVLVRPQIHGIIPLCTFHFPLPLCFLTAGPHNSSTPTQIFCILHFSLCILCFASNLQAAPRNYSFPFFHFSNIPTVTAPVPFFHSLYNFVRKLMTYEDVTLSLPAITYLTKHSHYFSGVWPLICQTIYLNPLTKPPARGI